MHKHYAKRIPSISFAFGLYNQENILQGVCTIGKPPSPSLCDGICGKENSEYVFELNRLCVNDGLPKKYTIYVCWKCTKFTPKKLYLLVMLIPLKIITVIFTKPRIGFILD